MPAKGQINSAIRDVQGNLIPWKKRNKAQSNAAERARRAKCPEKIRSGNRKYREENPFAVAVIVARRRAKRHDVISTLTKQEWEQSVRDVNFKCHLCGDEIVIQLGSPDTLSLDHVVPMSVGGTNTQDNVAPAHLRCNQARLNMSVKEFIAWASKIVWRNREGR